MTNEGKYREIGFDEIVLYGDRGFDVLLSDGTLCRIASQTKYIGGSPVRPGMFCSASEYPRMIDKVEWDLVDENGEHVGILEYERSYESECGYTHRLIEEDFDSDDVLDFLETIPLKEDRHAH